MDKQMSLSGLSDELSQVRTKKKEFLSQIERIVPWGEWIELIRPHYYKGERGNKPYDLERMLRIYLVQNLYDLSDKATVAEVIDSRAFSEFCGVESSNQVPDGDTLGRFRNLLLCQRIKHRREYDIHLRDGTKQFRRKQHQDQPQKQEVPEYHVADKIHNLAIL